MIQFKEIFTALSNAVRAEYGKNVMVFPERVAKPASFPAIWCIESNTYSPIRYSTLDCMDEQRRSMIEVQTFSNLSSGGTNQAEEIMRFCEKFLRKYYYRSTMNSPVENRNDPAIKRRTARFERIVGGGDRLPD